MGSKWALDQAIRAVNTSGLPFVLGLADKMAKGHIERGEDFLYADHAYFKRGWAAGHFRLVRGHVHLRHIVRPRPDDRLKRFGVTIEPWRKTGRTVVIIPPSPYIASTLGLEDWTARMVREVEKHTGRPIKVKHEKGRLAAILAEWDTWAVVCASSVAGVEAALAGYPVFSTPHCPSWPISAGNVEDVDRPNYSEARHEWACSLAYATWHVEELGGIEFNDYNYALRGQCFTS